MTSDRSRQHRSRRHLPRRHWSRRHWSRRRSAAGSVGAKPRALVARALLLLLPLLMLTPLTLGAALAASADAEPTPGRSTTSSAEVDSARWRWPLEQARVVVPFTAPAHRFGPGHRGIDIASDRPGVVVAPAGGTVAFVGTVADRAVLTIDHGDGLVTTFEPIDSDLDVGEVVARGQPVGFVSAGGHSAFGTLHFGVRRDGEYINPLLLLGGAPRAVLLPCCGPVHDR
jgi:murein DD-endopeptidase MepM/ murein hydrolase activator NlpD